VLEAAADGVDPGEVSAPGVDAAVVFTKAEEEEISRTGVVGADSSDVEVAATS
jgi:hypothetical protein